MDDCEVLTATEASRAFSELLHRVCYGGQSFVIKKGNRLMARITPVAVEQEVAAAVEQKVVDPIAIDEPLPDNITGDEAEYYQAWIEQVRKVPA